jgi:hypothetical protein
LLQACGLTAADLERTHLRGREGQRRGLSKTHGLIGRLARLAEARVAGEGLFEKSECRKKGEPLGLGDERPERLQAI